MKKMLRRAVAVCAASLCLALLTPLGPAALAGLLERGLGDWRVAIGEQSGAFLTAFLLAVSVVKIRYLGSI